jgi:hypothetical protein
MKKQKSALSNNSLGVVKKESNKSNRKNRDGIVAEKDEPKVPPIDLSLAKKGSKKDKNQGENYNTRGGAPSHNDNNGYRGGGGNQGYYGGNQGYDGGGNGGGGYYR